ncbi:60S ribosomal protein L28 isoform X2 [Nerophis ophidion]|uniref:60S ribosomal protein L28 isoform X2 n=1 Tax=Nerophis ophidion TaxID=159077 RepID=UPI002ADF7B43|nr:60S ribosomal protein L28 isoform X2 [Nerophis ophidion]
MVSFAIHLNDYASIINTLVVFSRFIMSSHLQWMVIRNCSSFLIKRNGQTYSTEPNNLKARNSYRFNGLVHKKTVGVQPAADGKGVVVVLKKRKGQHKPVNSYEKITINKNSRATLSSLRHIISKNKYRKDLRMCHFEEPEARCGKKEAHQGYKDCIK